MLNIVVPMAGRGSRFATAGYSDPKPLIPVRGVPMIRLVMDNLRPSRAHRFIFICQREHAGTYGLEKYFSEWAPGSAVVLLDGITEGAACTVLTARHLIDSDDALMIANSDQYVDIDIDAYLAAADAPDIDGVIMTMTASDPKWSFVTCDADGLVQRVVEKEVISDEATVGIYNFASGRSFVEAADAMIAADERVNNEFYVAPVYNRLVGHGARITTVNVGFEADGMYGLGTPDDLKLFLSMPVSKRAVGLFE